MIALRGANSSQTGRLTALARLPSIMRVSATSKRKTATIGILVAHMYSHALGEPFTIGTYALFAVLCGASSYIAVPAVQRMAIPEASPTLPLAASLGLTFSYNVTIGIPVYIEVAKAVTNAWPVATAVASAAGMS